jgi:hypothetical protein
MTIFLMYGQTALKSCGIENGQKPEYVKLAMLLKIVTAAPCTYGMKKKIQ